MLPVEHFQLAFILRNVTDLHIGHPPDPCTLMCLKYIWINSNIEEVLRNVR